jgi:hypothetical protein
MSWNKEDLSNYNYAESPWYTVSMNGKVDIGKKLEDHEKISLQPWGMYKMIHDFLQSGHQLSREQKDKLIELLK